MADTNNGAALLTNEAGNVDRIRTTDGSVYRIESTLAVEAAEAANTAAEAANSAAKTATETANTAAEDFNKYKHDLQTVVESLGTAEESRKSAEEARVSAENRRVQAENQRVQAEATRAYEIEYNRQSITGTYQGRDIATLLASEITGGSTVYDALHARAQAADFSGLRVGDYIDVPLVNASSVTNDTSTRFLIAHFDPYMIDSEFNHHHIAFVASKKIGVSSAYGSKADSGLRFNEDRTDNNGTASEESPYLSSSLKAWENGFEKCLPDGLSGYLIDQCRYLECRYSASGALSSSNGFVEKKLGKVWSLSEVEIYGHTVFGTPGYSVGQDCQFDLFRSTTNRKIASRCWLRTVANGNTTGGCIINSSGCAQPVYVSSDLHYPLVGFLLG